MKRESSKFHTFLQNGYREWLSSNICTSLFLGSTEVEQPKGTEVVRDAVRKLKFLLVSSQMLQLGVYENIRGLNIFHKRSGYDVYMWINIEMWEEGGKKEKTHYIYNSKTESSSESFNWNNYFSSLLQCDMFARHIKKSEGQKIPKVELQISIYGVKILEPKTKIYTVSAFLLMSTNMNQSERSNLSKLTHQPLGWKDVVTEAIVAEVQHNCQLHRISFCADDKTDKRIFTFICKDSESNKHLCYVFDSEKCHFCETFEHLDDRGNLIKFYGTMKDFSKWTAHFAIWTVEAEEITLTIGQAFDLAYRKFLESGGKDVETRKQIAGLQKRNLVFSCDFASLPDASHGDQSSRSSRCWIQDLETENMELKNKVQDLESQLRITQVSTSPLLVAICCDSGAAMAKMKEVRVLKIEDVPNYEKVYFSVIPLQLLHKMSDHEQHGFQRCSSSFWRSSDDSSPCLNISSITVTPVNSPDSRLSLGLLVPPPSKCGLPKPISESSIPRPHAGSLTPKSPSTDIFDMIPFSPISHQSSIPARNGTQPPPVPSRSTEIKRDLFGAEPFDPFNCGAGDFPPDIQSKLDEMQEGFKMGLTLEGTVFCLDPVDSSNNLLNKDLDNSLRAYNNHHRIID
ncbi:hypothetical protein HPG69_004736 [Diceros bicornis minor]|uniref:PID domain-containing protein n=1 Tax=Diceros bicornis minor TaxID=77932 RepID=A0A7J7E4J4_DICBM|nr:hypothetical protein HPG69_004736 [Diceros bicornis minor]